MNRKLAFKVGRQLGKIEEKLYSTSPFRAKFIDIILASMITDLEEGFGDNSDMIDTAEAMRGCLDKDDPSNSDKEKVRKGYFSLVTLAESKLEE